MSCRRKRATPARSRLPVPSSSSGVCGIPGWARNEAPAAAIVSIWSKSVPNMSESLGRIRKRVLPSLIWQGRQSSRRGISTSKNTAFEFASSEKAWTVQLTMRPSSNNPGSTGPSAPSSENGEHDDLESCVRSGYGPPTKKRRVVDEVILRSPRASESAASSRPVAQRVVEDFFANDDRLSLVSGHRSCFGHRMPQHSLDKTPPKPARSAPMRVSPVQLSRLLDGKLTETVIQKCINSDRWSERVREIQEKNLQNARAELEQLCFRNVSQRQDKSQSPPASPGRLTHLFSQIGIHSTTEHIRVFLRNGVPVEQMVYQLMETERAQTQIFNLESVFRGQERRAPTWDQRSGIGRLPAAITYKMRFLGEESEDGKPQPSGGPETPVLEWRKQWVDAWVTNTTKMSWAEDGV